MFADKANLNNRRTVLEEKLEESGVNKDNLKLLVLTHGDSDHCMNAAYIAKKYEVPIAMHKADLVMVNHPDWEYLMKTVNYSRISMKIAAKLLKNVITKLMKKIAEDFESFTPEILLKEGDRLDEYGVRAEIIEIPGYTPGSIGIVTEDGEAIVGDAGPGTINAFDLQQYRNSLKKIEQGKYRKLFMGHRNPQV